MFGRRSLLGRFLDMASFCVTATIRQTVAPKADTTVYLTNPPFFSFLGAVMKKIRNEQFVYVLEGVGMTVEWLRSRLAKKSC